MTLGKFIEQKRQEYKKRQEDQYQLDLETYQFRKSIGDVTLPPFPLPEPQYRTMDFMAKVIGWETRQMYAYRVQDYQGQWSYEEIDHAALALGMTTEKLLAEYEALKEKV